MNASQAKKKLAQASSSVGGTLEEDERNRGMRCLQAVAPLGSVWIGNATKHVRVDIETRRDAEGMRYNSDEVRIALETISKGHRPMTEAERLLCDE